MNSGTITLSGGGVFITDNASDAYRVEKGTVLVYIVPVKGGRTGRRSFIYETQGKDVVPAFAHRDIEYREWRFCFAALDKAELQIIENGSTKVLKERFAKKAGIKNYEKEGYEGGLVDQYRINIVAEDVFIRRTQNERDKTSSETLGLIFNAFHKKKITVEENPGGNLIYNAAAVICGSQKIELASYEKIKEACGDNCTIPDIARISHFAYREIVLEPGWEKEDGGSFIAFLENKKPVVCLSKGTHSYIIWDVENRCSIPVTKKTAALINPKAYMFYSPLPNKSIKWKDMARFCAKQIRTADVLLLAFLTIATSLIGLLTPSISQSIYDEYIPLGAKNTLFQIGCILGTFMISNVMFSIVKNISSFRISSRISYNVQSAVYDRLFNLPESFFRNYESADLAQRVMTAGATAASVANSIISGAAALVFIIIYFVRMANYSFKLALLGLILIVAYGAVYYLISLKAMKYKEKSIAISGKTSSIIYQFLNGISKLRIAGVEDRALYEYLKPYIRERGSEEKKEKINGIGTVLKLVSGNLFAVIFYTLIVKGNTDISLGSFIAFNSLFGAFSAYFMQLIGCASAYKNEKPNITRLKPVLEAVPEFDIAKELPGDITGEIEINNISFAYDKDAPLVIDGVSLNIKPGEYVGLVGSSGCGKSTLLKLLLGFEKPVSGKIYYDNKDIESIDKRELRKKMGVVLQDGRLISGSIFENITITAPEANLRDVNAAVEAAGLKNDVNDMPMGLHTVVTEGAETLSGGQRQRILIARAIISKPKILFFDEATSALDNITQSMVCDALEKMDSTRIVIAHRLSTIIKCDRIIVMDKGKIAEQGTYEELMNNHGLFYQLASRQMA